jgi:ubiquinone biosynthesis protein
LELFADLPKEIRRGIYTAKSGNLKIRVELSQLDEFQHMVTRGVRLLAVAGITSALVIGTSIVMSLAKKPKG